MSDFTRLLPGFYKLQKKNRSNLLCYSGLGGMWGSNPRHSEPQSDALPTELKPPFKLSEISIQFSKSGCKSTAFIWNTQIFLEKNARLVHYFG